MSPSIALLCALGLAVATVTLSDFGGGAPAQAAAGVTGSPPSMTLAGHQPGCWRGGPTQASPQRPSPTQLDTGVDGNLAALTRVASCLRQLHAARIS
jgi:hypothetical protein